MAVATFTSNGAKATTAAILDKAVFGVIPKNHELLKLAYTGYLANGRKNLAVTKERGDVRGGGKKPWRQKGTGRARVGSNRSPIWRGGGVIFGPTGNENYTLRLSTKAKRLSLRQALSLAAKADRIVVIEDIKLKEAKTTEIAQLLAKIDVKRRVLVVTEQKTPELTRAAANLQDIKVVQATYVNVFDVLNADKIIATSGALKAISAWLAPAVTKVKAVANGGDQ